MSQQIKLEMLGRSDSTKNEYYFTRPNLPIMVDMSKCVIFVHPWQDDDGTFGADMVIKTYSKPDKKGSKSS